MVNINTSNYKHVHLCFGLSFLSWVQETLFLFLNRIKAGFSDILELESLLTIPPVYKDSKGPPESKKGELTLSVISELSILLHYFLSLS